MDDRTSQARGPLPVQLRATYAAAVAGLAVFILLALLFPSPIHSYGSRAVVEQRTAAGNGEPFEFARLKQEQVEQQAHDSFLAYAPQADLKTTFADAVSCSVERRTPHCVEIAIETQDRYADRSLELCQKIAQDLVERTEKSFIPGIDALRIQRSNVEQRLTLVRESKRAAEDELTELEREHLTHFTAALEQATVGKASSDPLAAESLRLDNQRQQLLVQRNDLARTKTDKHPQVKEIDERLEETNRQISALAAKLRLAAPSKPASAKQQLATLQDDFRRKSQELSEAIAAARRREEDLLSEAARLAVNPAPIPLFTAVVQEPEVVQRNGGQPSVWQMLLLTIISLAASGGTYAAFRRFAAQQILSTPDDIESELGLPVLTLAAPPSAPAPLGLNRLLRRSVVAAEVALIALAASSVLLVTMQTQLTRHPARDPLGAVAESLDRTFGPTLRR